MQVTNFVHFVRSNLILSESQYTATNCCKLTYDYSINYFTMLQTTYDDQNIRIYEGCKVSHEHREILNKCKAILECTTCD